MKIASEPMPVIPAYVKPLAPRPGAGQANPRPVRVPLGGPVYRITATGMAVPFAPAAPSFDRKQAAEALLRFISARVAEHFGQHATLANRVVWLCFDAKKLADNVRDPGTTKVERLIQGGELAADLLGAAALVPKLEGLDSLGTSIHFVARIGDQAHRGTIALSQADLAEFFAQGSGKPATAEALRLLEDLGAKLPS